MHCLQGSVEGPQERTQIHVQSPYSPQQAHVPQPEQPPRPADTMAEKKKTTAGSSRSLRVCHEQEQELHVAARTTQRLKPSQKHTPSPHGPDRLHTLGAHPRRQQRRRSRRRGRRCLPEPAWVKVSTTRHRSRALRSPRTTKAQHRRTTLSPACRTTELRRYLRNNPCPSKRLIQQWLLGMATTPITESSPIPSFTWVMESMGWKYEHLGWFHYRSLTTLWTTGTIRTADAFDAQRKTGIQLYRRGGRACMQFNYYVLHYTMCGQHFIRLRLLQPHREGVGRHRVLASVKEHDTLTAQTAKSDRDIRREAKESRAAQPKKKSHGAQQQDVPTYSSCKPAHSA